MATLRSGSHIGPYEIVAPIGAGGMGEVYRARDMKLKRDVAIKVLPAEWSQDPERLSRAQREAEVLAALNHPHIAQIYGHELAGGSPCLVLEFVDGETLQERLQRGPISIREALEFARQIADALQAAHDRGIVHRDLKPANVKITPSEQAKVLDFGLAKTLESAPGQALSHSPTLVGGATGAGTILGTSAYMSPEQAKGRTADARSDIWGFGVVLYEMLTGKPAFEGDSVVEILGGVLKSDPDWTALPADTPAAVRSLLRRCLQKDPSRRLRHIDDARFQIEDALIESPAIPVAAAPAQLIRKGREKLWMMATLGMAVVALVIGVRNFFFGSVELPETRLQIVTPPASGVTSFAISSDGRKLVYQATANGQDQLFVRTFESERAQLLIGTENASLPFWSPDGRSIGFFADGKLKRIDIAGGAPRTLADAPNPPGGTWNSDGIIVFAPNSTGPLQRVSAAGGAAEPATAVDPPRQVSHRFPRFLPDGRYFLFFAAGNAEGRGVYVGSLDKKPPVRLFDADSAAAFALPDQLFFGRQSTLFAQRFDLGKLQTSGDPVAVADAVVANYDWFAEPSFSVSPAGTLVYRPGKTERQLLWFDRSGKQIGALGPPDTSQPNSISLSHDGRTVALARKSGGTADFDLWLFDVGRSVYRRLTFSTENASSPIWSPDNSQVVFSSRQKLGNLNIYRKSINGSGVDEPLVVSPENKSPSDWSPDGRFVLYQADNTKTSSDLFALSLDDRKSFALAATAASESSGQFSPDGHWVSFNSDETGRQEVYIQPFPGPGVKSQPISTNGGSNAQWRADGKEIYYTAPDNRVMAVSVTLRPNAPLESGTPEPLFPLRPRSEVVVARDGRFLINTFTEDAASAPLTVILNWSGRKKN